MAALQDELEVLRLRDVERAQVIPWVGVAPCDVGETILLQVLQGILHCIVCLLRSVGKGQLAHLTQISTVCTKLVLHSQLRCTAGVSAGAHVLVVAVRHLNVETAKSTEFTESTLSGQGAPGLLPHTLGLAPKALLRIECPMLILNCKLVP